MSVNAYWMIRGRSGSLRIAADSTTHVMVRSSVMVKRSAIYHSRPSRDAGGPIRWRPKSKIHARELLISGGDVGKWEQVAAIVESLLLFPVKPRLASPIN